MAIDRRKFLLQSGAMTSLFLASGCLPLRSSTLAQIVGADKLPPRKPLRDLSGAAIRYHIRGRTDADINNLLAVYGHVMTIMMSAIPPNQAKAAKTQSTPGLFSKYLPELVANNSWQPFTWWSQAETHFNHCAHGTENFLFWHRPYLFFFEKTVRKIACEIVKLDGPDALRTHPDYYTNWTVPVFHWDPATPVHPAFFNPEIFPAPVDNPETGTGAKRHIDRTSTPNRAKASWASFIDVTPATIENILQSKEIVALTGTNNFGSLLEGAPHGGIHVWVGGQMGAFFSPLDPIFWTHHAMIDFLFEEWMTRRRAEGQTSANFLSKTLVASEQSGFFDVDTGKPVSWANTFLIEKHNHMVTYDGLSAAPKAPNTLPNIARGMQPGGGQGFNNLEEIYVNDFNSEYSSFTEAGQDGAPPVQVLRTKLRVAEGKSITTQAIAMLEQIATDLKTGNQDWISSVQLRFQNLTVALEDPNGSTLQIKVRQENLPPFVDSNFAVFPRFGANVTAESRAQMEAVRSKSLNLSDGGGHDSHGNDTRGFMVDLLPVIARKAGSLDFKQLLQSETFTADFRVSSMDSSGGVKSKALSTSAQAAMNQKVKIAMVITRRAKFA